MRPNSTAPGRSTPATIRSAQDPVRAFRAHRHAACIAVANARAAPRGRVPDVPTLAAQRRFCHGHHRQRFPRPAAAGVGCAPHLRVPRRRHQRRDGRARPRGWGHRVRAAAPRGSGRLHGLRACEIHGGGGRMPRDVGPRRGASRERPLRREGGSPARRCDRGAEAARDARRRVPAGNRSRVAVQGCRARVRPDDHGAGAGAARDRPRVPHRPRAALAGVHHPARAMCRSYR